MPEEVGAGRPVRDRLDRFDEGYAPWLILAVAVAASTAFCLYLTRGLMLGADEYWYFVVNRGFDLEGLLSPHNGNLIAVVRLIYATVFKLFGSAYLPLRILEVIGIGLNSVLMFVLARRRVGAGAALIPAILLLFQGASPDVSLSPLGITHIYSVAAGLGALIALDRKTFKGDAVACGLLSVAVATFSIGLAFVAGVAVAVLLRVDRRRRSWIFLIPVALYALWYLAAPKYGGPGYLSAAKLQPGNVIRIPAFTARAASAVASALSGLNFDFGQQAPGTVVSLSLGPVLVVLAAVLVAVRAARGRLPRSFWAMAAIALALWISIVMVIGPNRHPNSTRYVYAGGVALLLALIEAARGARFSRRTLLAVAVLGAGALAGNVAELRSDGAQLRRSAAAERAVFTGIDLARRQVARTFLPARNFDVAVLIDVGGGTGRYLEAARRTGYLGYPRGQIAAQPEWVREQIDATLAQALRLRFLPTSAAVAGAGCRRVTGAGCRLTLRAPGVRLSSAAGGPVTLARFSTLPTVPLGSLAPGRFLALAIPRDGAGRPWQAELPTGRIRICALAG